MAIHVTVRRRAAGTTAAAPRTASANAANGRSLLSLIFSPPSVRRSPT